MVGFVTDNNGFMKRWNFIINLSNITIVCYERIECVKKLGIGWQEGN